MWKCPRCGKEKVKIPEYHKCSCGLFIATASTFEKYQILEEICEINDYDLVIEACAGSGITSFENRLIAGSPIRLAQIAKRKKSECIFIESDKRSFDLLQSNLDKYDLLDPSFEFIFGDCNEHLPKKVDDSCSPLVFMDPFGYGQPPIRREMVVELSKMKNVDLLFNFFWRICRQMGHVRNNLSSSNLKNRSTAQSFKKSLDVYWGTSDWIKWKGLTPYDYAKKYANDLGNKKPQIVKLPQYHKENKYFLIFVTNQNRLKLGIEKYL